MTIMISSNPLNAFDLLLALLNLGAAVLADLDDALVEALQVDLLLGLLQLDRVILALNLQIGTCFHRRQIAKAGHVNDGHRVEGDDHLITDAVFAAQGILSSRFLEHDWQASTIC